MEENMLIKESIIKIIDFLLLKQQSNYSQYELISEMPAIPENQNQAEIIHNKFIKLHKDSLNTERTILNNLVVLKEKLDTEHPKEEDMK